MSTALETQWNRNTADAKMASLASSDRPDREYAHVLKSIAGDLREPLERVETLLREQLFTDDDFLRPMLEHVIELSGKRLRPILAILSANALSGWNENTIRLAVAVELVHTATLIHDDILDGSESRRHRLTLHRAFDPQSSLLVGDWLFTQAYHLANQTGSTVPGTWLAAAAKKVCEGEIRQTMMAGDLSLSVDDYLEILGKKTGSLCAVSCSLGAWSANANLAQVERLEEFGWKLGQAFQVHDDYLDYWGDPQKMGKPVGRDFIAGKCTLPLIRLLAACNADDRQPLIDLCDNPTSKVFALLLSRMSSLHIEDDVRSTAINLCDEAIQ